MARADGKLDTMPTGDAVSLLGVTAAGLPVLSPNSMPIGWPANSILMPAHFIAAGTAAVINNLACFVPFRIPRAVTLTKLGIGTVTIVGSAGAQAKLALYADNGGLPDAIVQDGGTIALDSSTGHLETSAFSKAVAAGDYWGLIMINTTAGATFDRYGTVAANWVFNTGALAAGVPVQRYYTAAISYASGPPANASALTSGASNVPIMTLRN